jgi:hypothetical protein
MMLDKNLKKGNFRFIVKLKKTATETHNFVREVKGAGGGVT